MVTCKRDSSVDQPASSVRPVAIVQGLLAALVGVFVTSNMSVALAAENSHSAKPWPYKFAGAWENPEGLMLLWVTILAFAGVLAVAVWNLRGPPGGWSTASLWLAPFLLLGAGVAVARARFRRRR